MYNRYNGFLRIQNPPTELIMLFIFGVIKFTNISSVIRSINAQLLRFSFQTPFSFIKVKEWIRLGLRPWGIDFWRFFSESDSGESRTLPLHFFCFEFHSYSYECEKISDWNVVVCRLAIPVVWPRCKHWINMTTFWIWSVTKASIPTTA